jgi:hypothetical protein
MAIVGMSSNGEANVGRSRPAGSWYFDTRRRRHSMSLLWSNIAANATSGLTRFAGAVLGARL